MPVYMPVYWMGVAPLAVAAWADGSRRYIPPPCVFLVTACGVLHIAVNGWPLRTALAGWLLLGGTLFLLAVYSPSAVGGGDIKLCAALGLLWGPTLGAALLALALSLAVGHTLLKRLDSFPLAAYLLPAYMITLLMGGN